MRMKGMRIVGVVTALLIVVLVAGSRPVAALDLAFERTWGGPGSDKGQGVAVAPDGSVYLVGQTTSFGPGVVDGDLDIFLIKYGPAGDMVWQRTYGVARPEPFRAANEFAMDVEVGADGSVYMAACMSRR